MSDKNTFNIQNLKSLIDKHTREEIAKGIGCDTSLVTKHYNGDRNITLDYAIKYADFFGVSIDYICGRTENFTTDDELRFVCDYTGLNEKIITTLKTTYLDFVKYGTVSAGELEYVKRNYNEILLIMLQNNLFLWNIMQSKLSLCSQIRKEKQIKELLEQGQLNEKELEKIGIPYWEVVECYRYGNYNEHNLKKFLASEELRNIIDEYVGKELKEYKDLLAENHLSAQLLNRSKNDNSDGDDNAND